MNLTKLILLLGPTGCGKTTIIRRLEEFDRRFTYIQPYTTRPLRSGETDKVYVTESEIQDMWDTGALLVINNLYGIRYGTPRSPIEAAFERGDFPVIDWPIQRIQIMESSFPGKLFRVYIKPPSIAVLKERLQERIDYRERLAFATAELEELEQNKFNGMVDLLITNETGKTADVAKVIYEKYLAVLQQPKTP